MKENVIEGSSSVQHSEHAVHQAQSVPVHPGVSTQSDSSLGLSSNVGVLLVWLWWILALVFAIAEKRDRRIRTQAIQALIFEGIVYVISMIAGIGFSLVSVVLGITADASASSGSMSDPIWIVFLLVMCCYMLFVFLFCLGIPVVGIIMGLSGKELKLPFVYKWAENIVEKWSN